MRTRYEEIKALERRSRASKTSDTVQKQAAVRGYKAEMALKMNENATATASRMDRYKAQIKLIKA